MHSSWYPLNTVQPTDLVSTRLQLQYAIQFIAAVGAALAEPLPDLSHVSLSWNPELEIFVGTPIRAVTPFRVALDPISLTSILLDKNYETLAILPLHRQTLASGLDWLKSEIANFGVDPNLISLLSYPSDFPDHAIAHGSTFDAQQGRVEREELVHYYANTHHLLQEQTVALEDASPIQIWPHHFDMASLITLSGRKAGEPMTIGLGLSPGDESYTEPYWYVSPYPYPRTETLPELAGQGIWHTQAWTGAVLTASQLFHDAQAQKQQITAFLQSALQASYTLLNRDAISAP